MKSQAITALVVAAALGLSGCAAGPDTSTGEIETGLATGEVTYEAWTPTQEVFDKVTAGFETDNPDVTVTGTLSPFEDYQTSLQAQLRSGEGPDVFVVNPGAMLNQYAQYIEPLDSYEVAFNGDDWASDYKEVPLSRAQIDGKTYGLPISPFGVAGFLWVNRTLLDQAGVAVPTTWDEMVSAAADLRAAGIQPLAMGAKDSWLINDYYLAIAGALDKKALYAAMEGTGSWTDPKLVQAFEDFGALFTDGVVQDGAVGASTYTDTYDLFTQGKAAFLANGSWNLDMFVNSLDLIKGYDIDAMALPVPDVEPGASVIGDTGIVVVNKNSQNKAAAYQLATYMSHGNGAQTLLDAFLDFPPTNDGKAPTSLPTEAEQARNSIVGLIESQLAGYRQIPSASVEEALAAALSGLATGGVTPAEAAQRVQDAADNG